MKLEAEEGERMKVTGPNINRGQGDDQKYADIEGFN